MRKLIIEIDVDNDDFRDEMGYGNISPFRIEEVVKSVGTDIRRKLSSDGFGELQGCAYRVRTEHHHSVGSWTLQSGD